jgi:hypothetical protein
MLKTPLSPHYKTTAHVRPVRVAYFIPEVDEATFHRVVTLATTQWGGILSLIIPVRLSESPPFHRYYHEILRLFEPDWFVEFSSESDAAVFRRLVQSELEQLFPMRTVKLTYGSWFEEHDDIVYSPYAVRGGIKEPTSLSLPRVEGLSPAANAAMFGAIAPDQEKYYKEVFRELLPAPIVAGSSTFWETQFLADWNVSPINATSYHMRPVQVVGGIGDAPWFELIVGESTNMLCLYWASRALRMATQMSDIGQRTLLCPLSVIESSDARKALLAFLRSHLAVPNLKSEVHLLYSTWSKEESDRVVSALTQEDGFVQRTNESTALTFHFSREETPLEDFSNRSVVFIGVRFPGPDSFRSGTGPTASHLIQWREDAPNAIYEEPIDAFGHSGGSVAVDVETDLWQRFPRCEGIANLIKAGAWFSQGGLTRLARLQRRIAYQEYAVPSEWSALAAWFEAKGLKIRDGQAGKYGEAAVTSLGGLQGLGVIADRQTYRIFQKLALKSTYKVAQRLAERFGEQFADDEIGRVFGELNLVPELKGIPRSLVQLKSDQDLGPKDALATKVARLVEAGALRRGLYLKCTTCGSSEWHAMPSLDETIECPGCRNRFGVPLLDDGGAERPWQFMLNSLINRAVDQDVIPNMIALYRLTQGKPCSCLSIGLELLKNDVVQHEIDVIFVSQQEVYGAECKASGNLGDKDVATAHTAATLGFGEFCFVTTEPAWSDASKRRIEALRQRLEQESLGMRVSVVEGDQLFGVTPSEGRQATTPP